MMGRMSQQRRSRARMTQYNIAKANKLLQAKQNQIGRLKSEVFTLKEVILKLNIELENIKVETSQFKENFTVEYSQKMKEALLSQKNYLNERHILILEKYSEDLSEKYRKQFNESSKLFQSETSKLKDENKKLVHNLEATKQALLSSGMRKPVYSPGNYRDNG